MRSESLRDGLRGYGIALLAVVTALAASAATWPLSRSSPWVFFFSAVILTAWFGGQRSSFVTTIGLALSGRYLFMSPLFTLSLSLEQIVVLLVFIGVSIFIGYLTASRRGAKEFEREERKRFQATVSSIGDGVIATDAEGHVTFLNGVAEGLTGWALSEAKGRRLEEIFVIVNESTRQPTENPVKQVMKTGLVQGLANHTVLIAKDGSERSIEDSAAPIMDDGRITGVVLVFHDVTAKKLAEAEMLRLREEERAADGRALRILESITDAFFSLDRDWRFTYLNPRAEQTLRLKREDILGESLWEVYPGLAGSEFEREYRQVVDEGVARSFTSYYPNHDRWYEVHAYPASGGLAVYFRDVSERMRDAADRERLAAKSERDRRIYHAALSNTPDLVYVFDLDHRFIYANESLLGMWGRTWQGAIGKNCLELGYEPWHAEMHDRELEQVVATRKPILGEVSFNGTNGRRVYEYIFTPVIGAAGSVEAVAGTSRDVTDRKRSEEELKASEQRFRLTADNAPVLIWLAGADKLCYWFNKPWLEFTGRTMEQESGNGWIDGIHPEDLDRCLEVYVTSFDARAPFKIDYRLRHRDGQYRWVVDHGIPLHDHDGQFTGYIGSCLDIQDRVAAEEELRENDRQKDEFLAMLAHELRNPLSAVGNAVTVLKMSNEPEHIGFAKDVITRQMRHLTRLIDDLLDVSRISRGKIELRKDVVEATSILESAAESVRPLIEERKHTLELSVRRGTLWMDADPTRLEQVIVNLLNNAAKYSENSGRIRLTAYNEGREVVISVEDKGIGIPPEKLSQMFELFAQGDRSLARSEGGLGIGLTVVKKLVELHGGTVIARSEGPGEGCLFTIRLPSARERAAERSPSSTTTEKAGRRSRILVVDDNVDTARGLSRLLKLLGHDLATAHSGPEAIEVARRHQPEFVLLDIGLPGMDGYEVASRLRREECCKDAMIVAVSGYGQEEDRRRSREAGFDYHLIKPVDPDALVALLFEDQGGRG